MKWLHGTLFSTRCIVCSPWDRSEYFQPVLTRLLLFVCEVSPGLRRMLWRWWYGKLAREIATGSWTFMNYGYFPSQPAGGKVRQLKPEDESDRFCIQLYDRVASPVPLAGKQVLEVGCGRGGGSSYFARYHLPAEMTGIDYSPDAISFCQGRHKGIAHLGFKVGDAEKLPFPDASFDLVVNVESSHCYGDVGKFFSEVARVLRPGGHFVFADLRAAADMGQLKGILEAQSGWKKVEEEDITAQVAAALEADDTRKRKMIGDLVSPRMRPIFEEFAGVEGGKVFRGLQKRDLLYFRFAFKRN